MRTERDTARVMRDWMQEPAELDDRGVHAVLDRLPDTPQRRHRWLWPFDWRPFGSGATRSAGTDGATAQRRFMTMFTPIRVAAVTAVLALTGTLALVSGPLAPTEPAAVPGAQEAMVSMEAAYFTGTLRPWDRGSTDREVLADRAIEHWPVAWESKMTDPRVSGLGEATDYLETIYGPEAITVLAHTGNGRFTNDEGAYSVECEGVASSLASASIFCWYFGEEAYDGLTSFLILSDYAGGLWQAEGWIYSGERPPMLPYEP